MRPIPSRWPVLAGMVVFSLAASGCYVADNPKIPDIPASKLPSQEEKDKAAQKAGPPNKYMQNSSYKDMMEKKRASEH